MEDMYKKTLLLINSLARLSGICNKYSLSPEDSTGEKIIEIIDDCENKFLKVKEEVVKIVQEVENRKIVENEEEVVVEATVTENGFLIKE